jgi:hypothetical protein
MLSRWNPRFITTPRADMRAYRHYRGRMCRYMPTSYGYTSSRNVIRWENC